MLGRDRDLRWGRRYLTARAVGPALLAVLLVGCGAHLQDERMATTAQAADRQLNEADTLKPFDEQIANLGAFARDEDLAVARRGTSERDAELSRILASDRPERVLRSLLHVRLDLIAPAALGARAHPEILLAIPAAVAEQKDALANYMDDAAANLNQFGKLQAARNGRLGPTEPKDLRAPTCADLEMLTPAMIRQIASSGATIDLSLAAAARNCVKAGEARKKIADELAKATAFGGELAEAADDVAQTQLASTAHDWLRRAELQPVIDQAEAWAKESDAAKLELLRSKLSEILDKAGEANKVIGWDKAGERIDALLRATLCVAPADAVSKDDLAEAKCSDVEPTSTAGRAVATFRLLQALADLADANAPHARQANWLIAAKAIVAGERDDAALALGLAKVQAQIADERFRRLIDEAGGLAYVQLRLGGRRDLVCRGAAFDCAFSRYSDTIVQDRIPLAVLKYRALQAERVFAVRRARAAAVKQRALALAGTASLSEYAQSGIKPSVIAQILFDLGIFGAQVGG